MAMPRWVIDRLVDIGHAVNGAVRRQSPWLADKLESAYVNLLARFWGK